MDRIEKNILDQTEDQYPFATVYEQELEFYRFSSTETHQRPMV